MSCKIPPKIKISRFAIMQSTLMEFYNNVTFNVSLKIDRGVRWISSDLAIVKCYLTNSPWQRIKSDFDCYLEIFVNSLNDLQSLGIDNSIMSLIEYVLCFLNIHCIFKRETGFKIQ